MSKNKSYTSKKIFEILVWSSVIIIFTHLCLKYISVVVFGEQHGFMFELSNRFDLNDENSVPQWLTHMLFLIMAVSAFLASVLDSNKKKKRIWISIAIVGLVMAIDDVATLHEFVLQTLHNSLFAETAPTFITNAWLILLPFVLIALMWLCVSMIRLFPKKTTLTMTIGGVVFVFGAVIVDSIINNVDERSFFGQGILGAVEGGLQLLGMCIFIYGIHEYIESRYYDRIAKSIKTLKNET